MPFPRHPEQAAAPSPLTPPVWDTPSHILQLSFPSQPIPAAAAAQSAAPDQTDLAAQSSLDTA